MLGTVVTVTALAEKEGDATAAIEAAFLAIETVNRSMSTYRDESDISSLNRNGEIVAGDEFALVARAALEMHRKSDGAFDPTVLPLLELQRRSFGERNAPPTRAEIEAVLPLVDGGKVQLEGNRITLPPGARLTLDALAKGYAIDLAIEALVARGIDQALVDAGGDVRVLGNKAGAPWQVALQDPRDPARHLVVIPLEDRAVATSGDYRRYFDPEMKYHHILDPRTGASAEELISVTITATSAMEADALATAVFVLGVEEGLALVEKTDDVEAFLVTDAREIVTSSGW